MDSDIQSRVMTAMYACMRPLARVMLRSGITYKNFAEVAKSAFVHEAMLERDAKGRNTNSSRVAVRTGLSRKEVRRVSEATQIDRPGAEGKVDHSGPPARVLHLWFTDPRFIDVEKAPLDLPFEGDFPSFSDLVKAAGGDVPPGAVRAELLRASAVTEMPNGSWRPTKRYFVPGDFDEKTVTILSGILFPMISGVAHNSDPNRSGPGFIQRFAFARLGDEDAASFRLWSRDQSRNFIESIDDWLKSKESFLVKTDGRQPIHGIGVFYYEGPEAHGLPKPKP
jgi:hypothetical protein